MDTGYKCWSIHLLWLNWGNPLTKAYLKHGLQNAHAFHKVAGYSSKKHLSQQDS